MANIRVDSPITIFDGQALAFRSPADCSQVTGLIVYYPENGSTTYKVFQFADAHGNNIGDLDLFAADVVVKVILDTDSSLAFVQNADTNAYLEGRLDGKVSKSGDTMTGNLNIKTDLVPYINLSVPGNGQGAVQKNASATADNGVNVVDIDANGNKATLSLRAAQVKNPAGVLKLAVRESGGTDVWYNILHTGNRDLVSKTYTATVTATWTASGDYFYQDITVSGILATDNPIVDINPGSDNAANKLYSDSICKVFRITTSANKIRVWATEKVTTAFPIQLKVVR